MSVATDTFGRFLDVLAQSLDEPDTAPEQLAARLHLSRSHVHRLVLAASGEPPAALRRRVLLERAAYRLLASDVGVLDVAVEAGYGSHEAFTRAFARAYGVPPSQWRREPGSPRIEGSGQVHFHPPGGLRVAPARKVTGMDLVQRMVEHHVWLLGQLLDRAGQLSPEALEAPITISVDGIDENPTVRSLLARLVGQLAMWNAAVRNEPYDFDAEAGETLADLRAKLGREGPEFVDRVHETALEGRLDETFVDAVCEPPEVFTYGGMVAHVLTFAAHRRVLVLGALADAGITDLGAGDPMRWVAEPA